MSEEPKVEGRSITEELGKLGKQMADAIKAAWESEDRRKLQAEILDGLQKFGDEVTVALDKAGKSETAQDLRVKAEKVAVDVRASCRGGGCPQGHHQRARCPERRDEQAGGEVGAEARTDR